MVSNQFVSPASGDSRFKVASCKARLGPFPINLFPQRVGTWLGLDSAPINTELFPINLFPQRVGTSVRDWSSLLITAVSNQFVSPASGDR